MFAIIGHIVFECANIQDVCKVSRHRRENVLLGIKKREEVK